MRNGIIYKAECMVNGKIYIGQTVMGLSSRMTQHKSTSFNKNNISYNYHFHRAIRKHTWNAFKWEILEVDVNEDELDILEIEYITKFDTFKGYGYNMTAGGESHRGRFGTDSANYDHTLHTFYHQDGRKEINITQYELRKKYSINPGQVSELVSGKRVTARGWVTDKKNLLPTFDFKHKDGRLELGITYHDFWLKHSLEGGDVGKVISGKNKSVKGWKLIKL